MRAKVATDMVAKMSFIFAVAGIIVVVAPTVVTCANVVIVLAVLMGTKTVFAAIITLETIRARYNR